MYINDHQITNTPTPRPSYVKSVYNIKNEEARYRIGGTHYTGPDGKIHIWRSTKQPRYVSYGQTTFHATPTRTGSYVTRNYYPVE